MSILPLKGSGQTIPTGIISAVTPKKWPRFVARLCPLMGWTGCFPQWVSLQDFIPHMIGVTIALGELELKRESAKGPGCSLTRGLDVKLSVDAPAGFTVLSAVGAVPSA